MIGCVILAAAFYGLDFKPSDTNSATASCIYPVRHNVYRMVQPDGKSRMFELSEAEDGVLLGKCPWIGKIDGQRIDVWADPKYTGGKLRTAYTFIGGILRVAELDGRRFLFAKGPCRSDDFERLFPPQKKRSYQKNSSADVWQSGGSRLRLWFANPNSAGILLTEILLVLIWLASRLAGWGRIVAGTLSVAVLYGALATGSRSAVVGFVVGILALFAPFMHWLFTRRGLLILLSGLVLFGAGLVATGNIRRIADTFHTMDAGNRTRLKSCRAAVMMFSDAPFGWRGGEVPARNACLNWYVPDERHTLRTHVMSLAECGWPVGFGYVLFWVFLLTLGVRGIRRNEPLPGALWSAFVVAGMLNPVYIDWETWMLPALLSLCWFKQRLRPDFHSCRWMLLIAMGVSLLIVVGLIAVGKIMGRGTSVPIRPAGAATLINGVKPAIWIVGDELVLGGGGFPGREMIGYYERNPNAPASAYVYDVGDLPASADVVVLAGRAAGDYIQRFKEKAPVCTAKRIIMLSPSVSPDAIPEQLRKESDITMLVGNLTALHSPSFAQRRSWVRIMPGFERYISDWMQNVQRSCGVNL